MLVSSSRVMLVVVGSEDAEVDELADFAGEIEERGACGCLAVRHIEWARWMSLEVV